MKVQIVIDVEMCGVRARINSYPHKHEIIQIGAIMMDESYEIRDRFSVYVKPRYGKIDRTIASLTGISERDLKGAPDIEDALGQMLQWIGDNEAVFYSWSMTDYYQIRNEIQLKCKNEAKWNVLLDQANWVDYQELLGKRINTKNRLRLADALDLAELDTEGSLHDGLDDAYNTARLIAKLETQKDYKTLIERIRAVEENQKPLTTSLGDYLKGLVIK